MDTTVDASGGRGSSGRVTAVSSGEFEVGMDVAVRLERTGGLVPAVGDCSVDDNCSAGVVGVEVERVVHPAAAKATPSASAVRRDTIRPFPGHPAPGRDAGACSLM